MLSQKLYPAQFATIIGEYRQAQMFKFNNSIVPNKVRIGWHFLSNKFAYRDVYSALKSNMLDIEIGTCDRSAWFVLYL